MTNVVYDVEKSLVTKDGKVLALTYKEKAILKALISANGKPVSREALMLACWDSRQTSVESRTVDQHIARLRAKLGSAASAIETLPNEGYRILAGIGFAQPPLCPVGMIQQVTKTKFGSEVRVIFKGYVPKRGVRLAEVA